MAKRAAIYLRVSTDEQTSENQKRALREVAARSGHEIVAVYRNEGISGAKSRDKRPGFDAMHKDASRRKFDIVMAWSVDRLGRSLQDLIGFLSELHSLGIDLSLHQQGIDTTTPSGKAMFQMMGVFAEFERSMIVERVRAGVARAKVSGTKSGKAFGRPRTPVDLEKRIREALATAGRPGFHKIAAQGHNARMRKIDPLDGLLGLVDDGLERKDHWPEVREDQVPVGRRQRLQKMIGRIGC